MTKESLYEKYKFLIFKVIKDLNCQYRNVDEYEEYIYNGKLGLLQAINNYNPDIYSSSAYFYTSIRNAILLFFTKKSYNKNKINYIQMISLDSLLNGGVEFHELIPDETIDIEKDYIKKEDYEILHKNLNKLKLQYKNILCDFYGINTKKLSIEEMKEKYNITRQALYAKRKNAIQKLRKMYKEGNIQ